MGEANQSTDEWIVVRNPSARELRVSLYALVGGRRVPVDPGERGEARRRVVGDLRRVDRPHAERVLAGRERALVVVTGARTFGIVGVQPLCQLGDCRRRVVGGAQEAHASTLSRARCR